ncbi:hypothetical protein AQUCO_00200585v1 [Aquilegia coerulea]|uniref:CAAX prenyl protease 2/Lysostaphin resistance protein A-like domain-containing protein n=1 Tax=Aquilegia coerulea TaxID=218851 RepID=A0A2G5F3Y3_AQUCA|nr:hypothetical protein AQUCO_00200585v1 [Aquilegia coerulea]
MATSALITSSSIQSSYLSFSSISKLSFTSKPNHVFLLKKPTSSFPLRFPLDHQSKNFLGFSNFHKQELSFICFNNPKDKSNGNLQTKETGLDWPILKRWDVPWNWQRLSLTFFACGISFVLTGLIETAAVSYFGLPVGELSLDQKAELLFLSQGVATAAVLGVIYGLVYKPQPLSDDFFRYDSKEPFNLQNGWLLWAGVGLVGALAAIALLGASLALFSGEKPERETDALVQLLPLIGSSVVSTTCLVGITGVLAPLLEETVFRGFLMVSLTKWLPTPVSVLISAAVFALAHFTPGEFPQLFVLALGFSYSQTRNLLTPITIHALWNSGVILLLTFLQLQGYDIKELLQAS